MLASLLSIISLLAVASANPISTVQKRDVHCGTTNDATLSDCRNLVKSDVWNEKYNLDNTCHFTNVLANKYDFGAWNLACSGNCCAYYTTGADRNAVQHIYESKEELRKAAEGLLGCGDESKDKVNGLANNSGYSICLSNGDGCGDCFDDADFAFD